MNQAVGSRQWAAGESQRAAWRAWFDAVRQEKISQALAAVTLDVDAAVAAREPRCDASGRCCKFESYGHRLYVTGLEIAWFLEQAHDQRAVASKSIGVALPQFEVRDACVYQVDGMCSVHTVRPFGCRVYFCDPTSTQWQNDLYESAMDRVRGIHEQYDLPYRYMEWRAGLVEATASGQFS